MLMGTIVGAGVFGIPYVFAQAGFFVGVMHLGVLVGAVTLLHLFFGEIILRSPGRHRLVGYAKMYLGRWGETLISISTIIGVNGALLAYVVLGGTFFALLFPTQGDFFWSILLWAVLSLLVVFGMRTVALTEFFISWLLVGIFLFFFAVSIGRIEMQNLTGIHPENAMLPYGVVLFSLAGASAIPEIRAFLGREIRHLPKAIVFGTLFPAFLYILFAAAIVGIAGQGTAVNALDGIGDILGKIPATVAAAFGILAVGTSFLILAAYLADTYRFDFHMPRIFALTLSLSVPLAAFLIGLRSFIEIIGFVGIVLGGIEGVVLALIFLIARRRGERVPEYRLSIPNAVPYVIMAILIAGVLAYFFTSFVS